MKFTWETKDVRCGRRIKRGKTEYIIGYLVEVGSNGLYLIDLRDGAIMKAKSRDELTQYLTEQGYEPMEIDNG